MVLLLLTKLGRINTAGAGGISVKQTSDGAGNLNFKLSLKVELISKELRYI